ncbi:two-component regulator propeller domain-containing protein [Flagellimonas sp.]|uniref:hybrid sensor histidine kinase/response regulator n=1 Tax=Flagellimonas sp. TaxID=2058762 RepID=UPI003AB7B6F9
MPLLVYTQREDFRFKTLNTADGLSQSAVIAMEQDNLGRMWFGTRDGLNSYDGSTFTIFRNIPGDSTSISNNDILSILEDHEGIIWIGTYNGLNRYDPVKERFQVFRHNDTQNTLANNTIWKILETSDNKLWLGTSDGISIYSPGTGKFQNLQWDPGHASNQSTLHVLDIYESPKGVIWAGTSAGLFRIFRTKGDQYTIAQIEAPFPETLYIQDIETGPSNQVYLGTKYQGLVRFDLDNDLFTPVPSALLRGETDIRSMNYDLTGHLWVGTAAGVFILEKDSLVAHIEKNSTIPATLESNFVKAIFRDQKGSMWVGTYFGGISFWDISNSNFISYREGLSNYSLGHNVVSALSGGKDNTLYIGTEGGGVTIMERPKGKTTHIDKNSFPSLPSENIKSLLLRGDELWMGSFNSGVIHYHTKTERLVQNRLPQALTDWLENIGVYAIEADAEGHIWMGTFGKGVVHYAPSSESFQIYEHSSGNSSSLTSNRVRCILVDAAGHIWIGTQNGLNLLSGDKGLEKHREVKHYFHDPETLSGFDIQTIFQDKEGSIWVGTREAGLFRFRNGTFEAVPLGYDPLITSVYAVLEAQGDFLWISSNQGIIKYNTQNGKIQAYTQRDGVSGNEFNSGSAFQAEDGTLFFGGPGGLTSFHPATLKKNAYAPQVILTQLRIRNKRIRPMSDDGILSKGLAYTPQITLDHDNANFSILYTIPNFINPSKNQYRYRLLGLEEDWNLTHEGQAYYTIQKAGEYTFEVVGSNNDGVWNKVPSTLSIVVRPAPWKSPLAFVLYGLGMLLALWGLGWIIRSKARLKHQLAMENLEHQRNREIHDAKLRFFTNISHEFRTPLTLISGPLQQLLQDYKGSRLMYNKLLVIESNAKQLLQLINRLMDFRKLENRQYQLRVAEGNIVKFLREIYFSFSEYAKCEGYAYHFHSTSPEILVYYDRQKLEQVFYNLLSNAFRYTPKGGKVWVSVTTDGQSVSIMVGDTGVGIPSAYQTSIFDRFFEVPQPEDATDLAMKGTGIGLSIAKNIVDLHQGHIELNSEQGKGSCFTVRIPLGKDHLDAENIISDFKFSDDISLYREQLEDMGDPSKTLSSLKKDGEKQTLLIVEDDPSLRHFLCDLLKDSYNILQAANGEEAYQLATKEVPDLIVSDVIMPKMVGTELCSQIKANIKTSHIPFVLLTSRSSLIYKFEGLESGADDYISKPFNIKEFQLRIHNLLESSRRMRNKFSGDAAFSSKDVTVSSIDEKLLEKALAIVERNISNEMFDIHEFCTELGVSRTLLFTKIKAWTNHTPNEFIQELRMKRAAQLLEQGKMNITEVGYAVGFKDPKYFSKCFQKRFGERPSAYSNKFFD